MTGTLRRGAAILLAIAAAAGLVTLYRIHQRDVAREAASEQPVVAPTRLVNEDGLAVVTVDSAEARRIGLELAELSAASSARELRAPGEVVPETERTATLRAPLSGRLTVPAGAHWPALGTRVAAGVPIARVSDARPLSLPIGGIVTSVDAQPGALVAAGQALLQVTDNSRPLVRVPWPEPAGAVPARTLWLVAGEASAWVRAHLVGPALQADPATRRPVYLYRAERGWPGATPGTPVDALVAGGATASDDGMLVPDGAVVQWEGLVWAYRRRAPGRFERTRVITDRPTSGGWIAGAPFAPGDSVVVRGAQELLSEEFRARVTVGDESGE